jgi:hypothetical protein
VFLVFLVTTLKREKYTQKLKLKTQAKIIFHVKDDPTLKSKIFKNRFLNF